MSDEDLIKDVQDPADTAWDGKVSRKRALKLGAVAAAGVAGLGSSMMTRGEQALAEVIGASSIPYKAHTNVKGTITFWHFWGSTLRRGAINSIIADFEKMYPGVTVNALYVPFGDIWTKNIAAVAAGKGMPDVIIEDRPQLRTRAKQRIDVSLASLARRDRVNGSSFWPFTWAEADVNGQPYGLPYETDIRVTYWNKKLFQDAGLNPNKGPQNWDDLSNIADKLDAKAGNSGSQLNHVAFQPTYNIGLDVWAWNNGGDWQTKSYQPTFTSPRNIETLAWMVKWADRYGGQSNIQALEATFGPDGLTDGFMSQKMAIRVDIQGYESFLNVNKPSLPFDVGVTHITPNVGHKPVSFSGGFAASMPRGPRSNATRDAAWEFIKYLAFIGQAKWAELTYGMPTVVSIAKTNPTLKASPHWTGFVEAMSYGRPAIYNPYYPSMMSDLIGPATDAALSHKRTPKQALIVAQQQAITEINRNKRNG